MEPQIQLIGIETVGYNGTYTAHDVIDERSFEVTAAEQTRCNYSDSKFRAQMSTFKWHGATVRSGVFDDPNGILIGNTMAQTYYAAQRTSNQANIELPQIVPDTNTVTGTNTRFRDPIKSRR